MERTSARLRIAPAPASAARGTVVGAPATALVTEAERRVVQVTCNTSAVTTTLPVSWTDII